MNIHVFPANNQKRWGATLALIGAALCYSTSTPAQAQSQIPVFLNDVKDFLNQFSDNAVAYLINTPGSDPTDTTLDEGDRLRGHLRIETVENLSASGEINLDSVASELTAVFDITVLSKNPLPEDVDDPNRCVFPTTGFCYKFGPTPVDLAWANLPPVDRPAEGTMVRFYEGAVKNWRRVMTSGELDDGDLSPPVGDDLGSGPFVTEEAILALASDGDPYWDLGFTGVGVDANGQPLPAVGEGWEASGEEDIFVVRSAPPASGLATFRFGLSVIENFLGPVPLGQVASGVQPPELVDVNGSGSVLGVQDIQTPYDFFSNVDFVFLPLTPRPAIDIEKATNGVDADNPNAGDAPQIAPGGLVTWTYVVTNIGNVPLVDIVVIDDQGVAVSCPQTTLAVSESMICTASAPAEDLTNTGFYTVLGQCGDEPGILYENIGTAEGEFGDQTVSDDDPSHYCNPPPPPPGGGEGCTPGYWKQPHHVDSWVGFSPSDSFSAIFGVPYDKTLLEALRTGGGKEKALGRHAVAALLNASSAGVSYEFSVAEVIAIVQDAYSSGDFNGAKNLLEEQNELGCPLN